MWQNNHLLAIHDHTAQAMPHCVKALTLSKGLNLRQQSFFSFQRNGLVGKAPSEPLSGHLKSGNGKPSSLKQ